MEKLVVIWLSIFVVIVIPSKVIADGLPTSDNMDLRTNWTDPSLDVISGTKYNDVWGYVDCLDNEYAILGTRTHTIFFDVTDPDQIVEKNRFAAGANSIWRDYKTYRSYAYGMAEQGSEGLVIFDLSCLPDGDISVKNDISDFSTAHNLYVDEQHGRLYVVGSDTRNDGLLIYDLTNDPANPSLLASIGLLGGGYVHDVYVRDNIAYCSHGYNGYYIWDLNNPNNPVLLANLDTNGYNHSSWVTDDGNYAFVAEEVPAGLPILVIDLTALFTTGVIAEVHSFKEPLLAPLDDNTPHNPFIRGDQLIISYYEDGVQTFDISDPLAPVRSGYYDTNPANTTYNGTGNNWGVYPFLPSGTIIASDTQNGLFILSYQNLPLATASPQSSPEVDQDNDGICKAEDCDDEDALIGFKSVVGSACDDGNPLTTMDVILANGCDCAGTVPDLDCSNYTTLSMDICEILSEDMDHALGAEDCDMGGVLNSVECQFGGDPNNASDDNLIFSAQIGNRVWLDQNSNGQQDPAEIGVQGIEAQLFDEDDIYIKNTFSDQNGFFTFDDLARGNYYLKFIIPATYLFAIPNAGIDNNKDSDVTEENGIGTTAITNIEMAEIDMAWDAGLMMDVSLSTDDIIFLTARPHNHSLLLSWDNNHHDFIYLERSNSNPIQFKAVADVSNAHEYLDKTIWPNTSYLYRLRLAEEGKSRYSNIVQISSGADQPIAIAPNPAHSYTRLHNTDHVWDIKVFNQTGNLIKKIEKPSIEVQIPTKSWPSGIYVLIITDQNGHQTIQKLIVTH